MLRILLVDDNLIPGPHDGPLVAKAWPGRPGQVRGATAPIKVPELTPDIIISDVAMPGMSGYDLCGEIRGLKLPQRPYGVAVTGFGQESDRQEEHWRQASICI